MYSLPFSKSTEVLYYNKTFFEKNEISVPTTWDELYAVCKKIKQLEPDSIPLGYDSESNWFITMTEQLKSGYTSANAPHYVFDNAANKQFLGTFRTWYQEGLLTTQEIYGSYTSGLFTNINTADKNGKVVRSYISIGSSAGATHQAPTATGEDENGNAIYPFEVGIAPIPQSDATNKKVISQGPSLCLFEQKDDKVERAAWLFVKFLLTNANFQAEFSMASGYVPVLESVLENAQYQEFLASANGNKEGIAALSAKVCMEQADYYFTSPAFVGSSVARDTVGQLLIAVLQESDASKVDKLFADAVLECETLQ